MSKAVQQLKRESGKGLLVGGVMLPLALAELGSIDEYEFVVQPRPAGHGPKLFAGLTKRIELLHDPDHRRRLSVRRGAVSYSG